MIDFIKQIASLGLGGYLILLITTLFAVKEGIVLVQWFIKWIKDFFKPREDLEARLSQDETELKALENKVEENQIKNEKEFKRIIDALDTLIDSDKHDIKAYIIAAHKEFTKLKSIDYYSLECLEKRFKIYSREGGNTYIEDLMKDLRRLPLVTPANRNIEEDE